MQTFSSRNFVNAKASANECLISDKIISKRGKPLTGEFNGSLTRQHKSGNNIGTQL